SSSRIAIRNAHFTGRDTDLDLTGALGLGTATAANLTLRGNVNLHALELLNAELQAEGKAQLQLSIGGNIQEPNLNARVSFSDASLFFGDLPNGVENARGTIRFDRTRDRNRATIEDKITAQSSGGTIDLMGSVDFNNFDVTSALIYRLQATARQIRYRGQPDF